MRNSVTKMDEDMRFWHGAGEEKRSMMAARSNPIPHRRGKYRGMIEPPKLWIFLLQRVVVFGARLAKRAEREFGDARKFAAGRRQMLRAH